MADIQNDGRGSKYAGVGSVDGIVAANLHAMTLAERQRAQSDATLPDLTKVLQERGTLFSRDGKFAIISRYGLVQLRERKDDGSIGSSFFSRPTLLSLFESMEHRDYRNEGFPQRGEWS